MLHQQGQLEAAREQYLQALAATPLHFDALHLLGVIAHQQKNSAEAVRLIEQALATGVQLPIAYLNLGLAYGALQQWSQAARSYQQLLQFEPQHAQAHSLLGEALANEGDTSGAIAAFERACAFDPGSVQAHFNLGTTQATAGDLEASIQALRSALALQPDHIGANYNCGNALRRLDRHAEAIACYDAVLLVKPNHAEAHNNRGLMRSILGETNLAIEDFKRALQLDPTLHPALTNLAEALNERRELDAAATLFRHACELQPLEPYALASALHAEMKLCLWQRFKHEHARLVDPVNTQVVLGRCMPVLALVDDAALHRRYAEHFAGATERNCRPVQLFAAPRSGEPLRIGYFSSDFCNHAVAVQLAQLLVAHDRRAVQVHALSLNAKPDDPMQQRIARSVDHFHDVSGLKDREVAALSRELRLDIAVDLNGYTSKARPGIFALGCAPVQVAYLGYPGTTGAPYIDYLIADRVVIPEHSRQHYSEQIVYLPDSFMVNDNTRARSDRQFTRSELGLPEQGFVFRCYNNSYKILPEVFDCWMRLLQQVPGSVLWLLDENPTATANLKREAQQRGIDSGRLVFSGRIDMSEHFARNRVADLFLDTFPYTAHSTACDALWSGLPVLTRMGESFASRVAGSLLTAMNLPELITHSLPEYEARALHLVQHPQELSALRQRLIANRDTGPLFNTKTFARHIEVAYTLMHQRRIDGLPPAHLDTTLFSPIPIEHS
jgi:predicted O-linked N-acetylglucosamine transferase (SPINDLY family)